MMKRYLLTMMMALMACTASLAQKLSISSFEPLPNDISASTERRNDANNEACALLKVQLAQAGAEFVGNVVGEVKYTTSEYWVYMTDNSKRLQVKLPGYLPLDIEFAEHKDIGPLKSLATYRLVLELPYVGNRGTNETRASFFVMKVTPANASVRIDGELQTLSSEGTLSKSLKPGTHSYLVEAGGYEPKQETFTMGTERKSVTVNLVSNMATLSVECETAGADIFVNDGKVGSQSRWTGTLAPAEYVVEARREGYYPQQKSISLGKKQSLSVKLPALVARVGSLEVNYSPIDADVWIDGVRKGLSPDVFRDLLVGSHRVEIRKDGYEAKTATIAIKEGETTTLSGNLKAATTSTPSAQSYKTCPDDHHPHMIDLGLPSGTKWACCNVGATRPEEYGGYYAWGETEVQADNKYDWSSYRHCDGSRESCHNIGIDISGTQYDVAHVKMGGLWHMPTFFQIKELLDNCKRTWTTRGGKKGIEVTGPNGGKVFLPAAGHRWEGKLDNEGSYGIYWSSSFSTSYEDSARFLYFSSGSWYSQLITRSGGRSVRAVCP